MGSTPRDAAVAFYDGDRYTFRDSTGHLLAKVMGAMRRELEQRMAALDLTDAQWKPLLLLAEGRSDTAFELSREMGCDAGAMTRMLDRLVAKGLVERTRSQTDRRVLHLKLTEAGRDAAGQVPRLLAEVNNAFLRGFSEAEWKQLDGALRRMIANGDALAAAGAEETA